MSNFSNNQAIQNSDSGPPHTVDRFPATQRSFFWYSILYLVGLLSTNGLADAIYNVLHKVM